MTFIPTEKPPRRTRWELTPDEWRLLVITFLGGIASIVLGAATIGVALALLRWVTPGRGWEAIGMFAFTVGIWAFFVFGIRKRNREGWTRSTRVAMVGGVLSIMTLTLMWVGVAAGVH